MICVSPQESKETLILKEVTSLDLCHFSYLGLSCKQNYTVLVLLCLAYVTWCNILKLYPCWWYISEFYLRRILFKMYHAFSHPLLLAC